MNKKGISTIVATVLIVLITVAAVTILWAAISPLIDQNLESGAACFEAQNKLKIDSNREFTCYNDNIVANNGNISIRIMREANSELLQGYDINVEDAGSSLSAYQETTLANLPTANGGKVVVIAETALGLTDGAAFTTPVMVSIAPMIKIDGELRSCEGTVPIEVQACL